MKDLPCRCAVVLLALVLALAFAEGADAEDIPVNALSPDGYIRNWVLLGPFPSADLDEPTAAGATRSGYGTDYLAALGGEAEAVIQPGATVAYTDENGRWCVNTAVVAESWDSGHLCRREFDYAVGYAFSYIDSDAEREVIVYFGSDGSPRVWLNGEEVISGWQERHKTQRWMYARRLTLREGLNRVLVKLDNRRGWWGFQTEFYRPADHRAAVLAGLKRLAVSQMSSEDVGLSVTVSLEPRPLDVELPVRVRLVGEAGEELFAGDGNTGEPIRLVGVTPTGRPVIVEAATAPAAQVELTGDALRYLGDFAGDRAALADRFAAATRDVSFLPEAWRDVYVPVLRWARWWFDAPATAPDEYDIRNLLYLRSLTEKLEAGSNALADDLGATIPCYFFDADAGDELSGQYCLTLPEGFDPAAGDHPLVINLHGSGGTGMKINYVPAPTDDENAGAPVTVDGKGFLYVAPRATREHRWSTPWLDAMLADVTTALPVDSDRIYLKGFSMGGYGTWSWATDRPEHFAAVAPMAGAGSPFRVARMKHVPVWAFQGGKDAAVPACNIERTISALRDAGGAVRYRLFSESGHGDINPLVAEEPLTEWFARHTRSGEPAPPDPIEQVALTDGVGEVKIVNVPAEMCLSVSGQVDPGGEDSFRSRASATLFNDFRTTGELARGHVEVVYTLPSEAQAAPAARTFRARLPLGELRVDTTLLDSRVVEVPAARMARFLVRCESDELAAVVRSTMADLQSSGHKLTGEVRQTLLHSYWPDEGSLWRVGLVLDE
ncbi:MAG: dienelactone hydrolase family protein [Phycisphaerae bacterium]